MPADIILPSNARSFSFITKDEAFNSNYDITWSYQFTCSSVSAQSQYGLCTFLTLLSTTETNVLSGHYLNTKATTSSSISAQILSAGVQRTLRPYNLVSIAIDTTGLFALSSSLRPGLPLSSIKPNRLIVRDILNNVILNDPLSTSNISFSGTHYFRFNYSNSTQTISIDHRIDNIPHKGYTLYTNIATVSLNYRILNVYNNNNIRAGFTFCSPLSTSLSAVAATVQLYNFHVSGVVS